jgi:sulfane dehydrogenase subunit SoxC
MVEKPETDVSRPARREFLKAGLLGGAALAGRAARHRASDPLITEIQDWNRYLGDGVDARPYGTPSEFEKPCGAPQCAMADGRSGVVDQFHAAA